MPKEKAKFERIAFVASEMPEAIEAQKALVKRYGKTEPAKADAIVALGGDGLMLQTLHRFINDKIPTYGMNRGSVGFLMNDYGEDDLKERLAAAETAVKAKEENGTYFVFETALEVLQQAADEYEEAIDKGRIVNVVEYQDARGFVLEVDRLLSTVMPAISAKNADAAKAVQASLNDLKSIFPSVMPPKQPVKDIGPFLSDVSKIELQLGNLR